MKKAIGILGLFALIIIFQNWQTTIIHVLFWQFAISQIALLSLMALAGGVFGYCLPFRKKKF